MQNPEFHMDWNLSISANLSCESAITLTAMINTRPENPHVLKWLPSTSQVLGLPGVQEELLNPVYFHYFLCL